MFIFAHGTVTSATPRSLKESRVSLTNMSEWDTKETATPVPGYTLVMVPEVGQVTKGNIMNPKPNGQDEPEASISAADGVETIRKGQAFGQQFRIASVKGLDFMAWSGFCKMLKAMNVDHATLGEICKPIAGKEIEPIYIKWGAKAASGEYPACNYIMAWSKDREVFDAEARAKSNALAAGMAAVSAPTTGETGDSLTATSMSTKRIVMLADDEPVAAKPAKAAAAEGKKSKEGS